MNGLSIKMPESIPKLLSDSDNVLVLVLIFMLMKQKANQSLVIALLSIIMTE